MTNWLTVPDGLTQVVAALGLMPRRSAHSAFVSMTTCLSRSRTEGSPRSSRLSQTPVRLTPSSRSSLHVSCHIFLRYLKSVKVDWIVPRIEATRAFLERDSIVSLLRHTISVRGIRQGALLPCQRFPTLVKRTIKAVQL